MSRKYIVQIPKLIIIPLIIAVLAALFSFFLQQRVANENGTRILISALTTVEKQISQKRSEIASSTALPIDGYHPKDTLLYYRNSINLEHIDLYDNIIENTSFYLKADTELLNQLANFKRRDEWLINNYNAQETDSARLTARDDMYKQLSYEKEILIAEIDFLKEKILMDSLQLVRDTSFRKYL